MILLVDNYDSFVFNLARYCERLGQATRVVRNDAIDPAAIAALGPAAIVLSPGPRTPSEAGCSLEVVRQLSGRLPILGICLGHQAIGAALGGRVVRAVEPVHGRASQIFHGGKSVFAGLESPLVAARYHSLVLDRASLPAELEVTAWTADGTIMAVAHRAWPVVGLQFHPESILTHAGYELLAAFLRLAGIPVPAEVPRIDDERSEPPAAAPPLPTVPVTF
jgi:anthranilate synthase/aminodeoxychorismate synthase-like glutamine amidotransferase